MNYKIQIWKSIFIITYPIILVACASTDRVVFVTSTEIGIGADAKTGNANIGYDRNELVLEPVYVETGATPPVYGSLDSNLEIFSPKIKQLYATGNAAEIVTDLSGTTTEKSKPKLTGKRRLMVFGTSSNIGLKIHATGEIPDSINFGYKRKEFSVIPLQEEDSTGTKEDKYASTIAGIGLDTSTGGLSNTGMRLSQFIATGVAAENIAQLKSVKETFKEEALDGFESAVTSGMVKGIALNQQIYLIVQHVATDNMLDKTKLKNLINSANIEPEKIKDKVFVEAAINLADLKGRLEQTRKLITPLYKAIP